jgi:hypothetical protein
MRTFRHPPVPGMMSPASGFNVAAVDFDEIRRIVDYEPIPRMRRGNDFGIFSGLSMVKHLGRARVKGSSRDVAVIRRAKEGREVERSRVY